MDIWTAISQGQKGLRINQTNLRDARLPRCNHHPSWPPLLLLFLLTLLFHLCCLWFNYFTLTFVGIQLFVPNSKKFFNTEKIVQENDRKMKLEMELWRTNVASAFRNWPWPYHRLHSNFTPILKANVICCRNDKISYLKIFRKRFFLLVIFYFFFLLLTKSQRQQLFWVQQESEAFPE